MLDFKKIFVNMSTICNSLYRVQILTKITPSKEKKKRRENVPYKKQIPQAKQIRMWPVTFNVLYLILCKFPELVPGLENIVWARRDLNGQIAQVPHPIEAKIEMQRGKLTCIYKGTYHLAMSGTRVLTLNSCFFTLRRTQLAGLYRDFDLPLIIA